MTPHELLTLAWIHLSVSPLTVGGAMTVAPELHRLLVTEHGWLSDRDFTRCITLAQAAPGPNVLYIALVGWTIGITQAAPGGTGAVLASGGLALLVALVGVMMPSSLLTLLAMRGLARWHRHLAVRAFRAGMAPVVVAAMGGTAAVLARGVGLDAPVGLPALLAVGTALAVVFTRIHLLWWVLLGAGAGAALLR